MRAAILVRDVLGATTLVAALLLASPGVLASRADAGFSYDPALDPAARPLETAATEVAGPACPASRAALPQGALPLLVPPPTEGEADSSLNGRGYNIGPANTLRELQVLRYEARRAR